MKLRSLAILAALASLTACSSSSVGAPLAGSAASGTPSTSDPAATVQGACVYQQTEINSCGGYSSSGDPEWTCVDTPCSQASMDPTPIAAGDCYGYTQYDNAHDYSSCADWEAAGKGDGCGDLTYYKTDVTRSDACHSCVTGSCCSQALACISGTDCNALVMCFGQCQEDDSCLHACEKQYPGGVAPLAAWFQCEQNCNAACDPQLDGGAE